MFPGKSNICYDDLARRDPYFLKKILNTCVLKLKEGKFLFTFILPSVNKNSVWTIQPSLRLVVPYRNILYQIDRVHLKLCHIVDKTINLVPIRTPKVKQHCSLSVLGRVMPLDWPAKRLRIWCVRSSLICFTIKCSISQTDCLATKVGDPSSGRINFLMPYLRTIPRSNSKIVRNSPLLTIGTIIVIILIILAIFLWFDS